MRNSREIDLGHDIWVDKPLCVDRVDNALPTLVIDQQHVLLEFSPLNEAGRRREEGE